MRPQESTKMIDYSKITRTYEAQSFGHETIEYLDIEDAKARIQSIGSGELITWRIQRNIEGCLPEWVHKSLALDVYDGKRWKSCNIF
jgi:hypothetical protein